MSQGIHSGELHLFLVGDSHRELLVAGAGATAVTRMEKAAGAGEIVLATGRALTEERGRPLEHHTTNAGGRSALDDLLQDAFGLRK